MYFQQGDTLHFLHDLLPEGSKKLTGNLIHKGNNHFHRIEGSFELYECGVDMFILALDTCDLVHEEHKTIQLPAGLYKKGIVVEYDHLLEESREVVD